MPTVIPLATRCEIVRLCQSGKTATRGSRELNLAYPDVARVWRLFRRFGASALETGCVRCGREPVYSQAIREQIDQTLEDNEPTGAPIIQARLLANGKFDREPHERTIQCWWKKSGKNKPRGRRPRVNKSYTREPHHHWQIDGKENVVLAKGHEFEPIPLNLE